MSTITTPREDIATIIETTKPGPPQTCHLIGRDDWALCGLFKSPAREGMHSQAACRAAGHKICVVCTELARQLGGERMVA